MSVDPKRQTTKTGELLAAYVDGVGEMDVEERRRVERYLAEPGARAEQDATRGMIDQLRELGEAEPQVDWSAMERAIHAEVGDEVPKRSFWYRWRFALPAFALAAAAAIVFLVIRQDADEASPIVFVPKPPTVEQPVFEQLDDRVTVYLDGTDLEIALDSDEEADRVDAELDELALTRDLDATDLDSEASLGFLEPTDLAWIDDLDDDALDRLERSLRRKGS